MPGINIEPLSKDQYKVYADVQQTIYDGGMIANQKKMAEAQADIELQKNQVEIDRLEERINQLYFGVLQTDEQIAQTDITKSDIERAIKQAEAQLKNGVIFRSQLEVLKAQLVSLEQKQIELRSVKKSFLDMLSLFIKKPLSEDTQLIKPEKTLITDQNNRAELKLFDLQTKSLDYQKSILKSKNLPKLGAFFQGGYGKPGMNMLKNEFDWFYIGGLRLTIPISGFYTYRNDLSLIENQKQEVEIQRQNFLFNQNFQNVQNNNDLQKIQQLIDKDEELITLRESVMASTRAQLQNGVITTSDFLREVNELDRAKNMKIQHEIQYLLTQYNLKAQLNN